MKRWWCRVCIAPHWGCGARDTEKARYLLGHEREPTAGAHVVGTAREPIPPLEAKELKVGYQKGISLLLKGTGGSTTPKSMQEECEAQGGTEVKPNPPQEAINLEALAERCKGMAPISMMSLR